MVKNRIRRKIKEIINQNGNLLELLLPLLIVIAIAYTLSPEFKNISNLILNTPYSTYSVSNPSIYTTYFQIATISGSALLGLIPIFLVEAMGKIHEINKKQTKKHYFSEPIFGIIIVALFLLVFFAVAESFGGFISYAKFMSFLSTNNSGVTISVGSVSLACSNQGYVNTTDFNKTCGTIINTYNQVLYSVEYSIGSLYYAFVLLLYILFEYVIIVTYKQKQPKGTHNKKQER